MCLGVLLACMSMHHMLPVPHKPEEDMRAPGTGAANSCELLWLLGIESRSSPRVSRALKCLSLVAGKITEIE